MSCLFNETGYTLGNKTGMAQKKTTEEYFDSIIQASIEVGIKKMSEYGTSWTSYRPGSLLTRMLNKGKRVVVLQDTGENHVGESIKREFIEILSYAAILGIMTEQNIVLHSQLPPDEVTKYRLAIFQGAKDIMIKKNHDYGEAWREMEQAEIIDEINVKIQRMKCIVKLKQKPNMDNVYDVINYCAFALILLEEGVHKDI